MMGVREEPERLRALLTFEQARTELERLKSQQEVMERTLGPTKRGEALRVLLAEVERLAGERDEALVERDELADYIEGSQAECERLAGELKEESRLVETAWRQRDDETMKAMRAEAERERLAGRVAVLETALTEARPYVAWATFKVKGQDARLALDVLAKVESALADVGGSE